MFPFAPRNFEGLWRYLKQTCKKNTSIDYLFLSCFFSAYTSWFSGVRSQRVLWRPSLCPCRSCKLCGVPIYFWKEGRFFSQLWWDKLENRFDDPWRWYVIDVNPYAEIMSVCLEPWNHDFRGFNREVCPHIVVSFTMLLFQKLLKILVPSDS